MKAVILAAVILVIFALIFPLMVAYPNTRTADKPGGPAGDSEGPEEVGDTVPEVEDTGTMDGEFKLTLLDGGEVREMSLAQYLRGSLGAAGAFGAAVYAGGDAVTGAATVISAMGAGKTAARAIDEYLSAKR